MHIGKHKCYKVTINNNEVEKVAEEKYLGQYISNNGILMKYVTKELDLLAKLLQSWMKSV